MPRLGAHMSAAGGLPLAVERAALHRCESLQLFTRGPSQWRARTLHGAEVLAFRQRLAQAGIWPAVSHASYLINLATADPALRARSVEALGDEIDRAEALGLLGVVIHPGAGTGGTEARAVQRAADSVRRMLERRPAGTTLVLLEGTAGQGATIGHRFEHLAGIIGRLGGTPRVGVCLDTCHLFAAGFDLSTERGYRQTVRAFDRIVGLERLHVVHLNDSVRECGSRVDRHAHIGRGRIGLDGFARLLRDRRLAGLPMVLETPKAEIGRPTRAVLDPNDERNLGVLRGLIAGPPVSRAGPRRTPRPRT